MVDPSLSIPLGAGESGAVGDKRCRSGVDLRGLDVRGLDVCVPADGGLEVRALDGGAPEDGAPEDGASEDRAAEDRALEDAALCAGASRRNTAVWTRRTQRCGRVWPPGGVRPRLRESRCARGRGGVAHGRLSLRIFWRSCARQPGWPSRVGGGPVVLRPLVAQGLPLKQYETYTAGPLRKACSDSLSWHWDRPVTWLLSREGDGAPGEPGGCDIATVLRW